MFKGFVLLRNAQLAARVAGVNSPLQRVVGRGLDCLPNGNLEIKVGFGLRVVDLLLRAPPYGKIQNAQIRAVARPVMFGDEVGE